MEFNNRLVNEFLREDNCVGDYIAKLIYKYYKKSSKISDGVGLSFGYVGNILNRWTKKSSRNVLICICFAIGNTFEEAQYLLKYAGHTPPYVRNRQNVFLLFVLMEE